MLPSLALVVAFTLPLPAPVRFDRHGDPLPPGALARFGTHRFSSSTPTLYPAFSPDGKRAVFRCEFDRRVCVLDITTGRETAKLDLSTDVNGYAFLTDSIVAIATSSGVQLWEPGTTDEPVVIPPALRPEDPICVARSPDGTRFAVGGYQDVCILSYPACELVARSETDKDVTRLLFSPDGKQLLGQVRGNAVRQWDAASGKRVRTWIMPEISRDLAFAPDGKSFFAIGSGWVTKQPLADDTPDPAFSPASGVSSDHCHLHLSADGKKLRILCDSEVGTVVELDSNTGKRLATLKQPEAMTVTAYSRLLPDGKTVLGNRGGRLWRWDAETGESPVYEPHGRLDRSTFAPDGKTVRTLSNGDVRYTWDATTGKPTADPISMPDARAWDRTLTRVAETAGQAVAVREVGTGKELARLPCPNAENSPLWFQPDPTGDDLLAAASEKSTDVWHVAGGRRVFSLQVQCERGTLFLSARRRTVFRINRSDGQVQVWETASGQRRATEDFGLQPDQCAADPDGRHVWAFGRGNEPVLERLDVSTGKSVQTIKPTVWLTTLTLSADGRRAAGYNPQSESLVVLDTATGQPTHAFRTPDHNVTHCAFNADATSLVTSGSEGVAYVWDLSRPVPLAETPKRASPFRDATSAVATLWTADAAIAHLGMAWLTDHPADAVKALAAAFPPAVAVPAATLEKLLADRDSPDFKTRLKADKELTKLGPLAVEALKAEAEKPRSEEVRAAVETLLAKLDADEPTGERLAEVRAVEVAERLGTPEAAKLLAAWAGGAPTAALTREAKAASTLSDGPPASRR